MKSIKVVGLLLLGLCLGCGKKSETVTACTLDSNTTTPIGLIYSITGTSASKFAANAEQFAFVKTEVNAGCGMLGTATTGHPVDFLVGDDQDDLSVASSVTNTLIGQGVKAVILA